MNRNNILDIGMETVRASGLINMISQSGVKYYAFKLGFYELVTWLEATANDYMWYKDTLSPKAIPSLSLEDIEYLIDSDNDTEARNLVEENFLKEINEYRENPGFKDLKQLPINFEEYNQEINKASFTEIISNNASDHAFNYMLPMPDGSVIIWLQDYFYQFKKGKLLALSADEWATMQRYENKLTAESKGKFKIIDEHMRLAALFSKNSMIV